MALAEVKDFFQPQSSHEVVELLARYGDRALLLGGGTFLHGLAARGLLPRVEALIDLQKAGLTYVKSEAGALAIGATTTFAELAAAGLLQRGPAYGAVQDALRYPPPQICNMATVGGCVASATPLFDLPVAFLALDASITALGPRGSREMGLSQFFRDYFEHALEKAEFLTEVRLPAPPPRSSSVFLKLETNANDLAVLNLGVRISLDASGIFGDVRVFVGGGVGNVPIRAASSESILTRQRPSPQLLDKSAEAVAVDVHPLTDHRASAQYRTAIAKVFVKRALTQALLRLGVELR